MTIQLETVLDDAIIVDVERRRQIPWFIQRIGSTSRLCIEIDPGGMAVFWVDQPEHASAFHSEDDALQFVNVRLLERYPDEQVEVVREIVS